VRIFLKLFFSFWITALLVALSVGWLSYQLRGDVEEILRQEMVDIRDAQNKMGDILVNQGLVTLKTTLASHPRYPSLFVIGPDGGELFDRELPRSMQRRMGRWLGRQNRMAAHMASPSGEGSNYRSRWSAGRHKSGGSFYRPLPVKSPSGELYYIVTVPSRANLWSVVLTRHPVIILLVFGVSGLIVFLLARHFSLPIQSLKKTSLQLAKGDLQVRCQLKRSRIPDELSDLSRDFNFMADRLEELFHAQKRLLRDVSHELRSPLARMRAALGLLEQERENENHTRLETELETLDQLIGQIITISRPDQSGAILKESWVDLGELMRTIMADASFEDRQNAGRLLLDGEEGVIIQADARSLHSALENIVRNALLHTAGDGVVTISIEVVEPEVILTISDQGKGVPEQHLAHIFEPFFRMDEARGRQSGGFGLGLAIAAKVIRDHGGKIEARNRASGGLDLIVRLSLEHEHGSYHLAEGK
jgi:signal transduction histidine kinase